MSRPQPADFPPYFGRYISLVKADHPAEAVSAYSAELNSFYASLPDEKSDYRYAEGKWTVKDVLQHMIDAERIFSYRILRIARKDSTPLASFDENSYAENAMTSQRKFSDMKEEFLAVRKATDLLILSLSNEQLSTQGTSSNSPVTANAIAFIVFGHLLHHQAILKERYLG